MTNSVSRTVVKDRTITIYIYIYMARRCSGAYLFPPFVPFSATITNFLELLIYLESSRRELSENIYFYESVRLLGPA